MSMWPARFGLGGRGQGRQLSLDLPQKAWIQFQKQAHAPLKGMQAACQGEHLGWGQPPPAKPGRRALTKGLLDEDGLVLPALALA